MGYGSRLGAVVAAGKHVRTGDPSLSSGRGAVRVRAMTIAHLVVAALVVSAVVLGWRARRRPPAPPSNDPKAVEALRRVYSRRHFLHLGGAVAGAAVLVYSGADEAVDDWNRDHGTNRVTEPVAEQFKQFGEPYWAFVWVVLALIDRFVGRSTVGAFGRRCMLATAYGLPILWTTQRVLGASRPTDDPESPRWAPFEDENAASGHTFIAAVPWIVWLRSSPTPWVKWLAGLLSPATGWSRIHDRKHYLSQVVLGWVIAWEAVDGVIGPATPKRDEA